MKHLYPFCTPRQLEVLKSVEEHGSVAKASRAINLNERTIRKYRENVERKAALAGVAPDQDLNYPLPAGQVIRGTSTLIDKATGESRLQWVKTTVSDQEREAIQLAAIEALKEDLPKYKAVDHSRITKSELATVYTLTDCHVGMKAWGKETGADWDLDIAEKTIVDTFYALICASPDSETGVVAQLGDFLHADSITPVTPTSGNLLDADDRFSKVVQVAIRILRRVIQMALEKHKKVIVLMAEGNHDLSSSIWLRELFKAVYENEKRVSVIDSVLPYYVYKHGKTLLAWHHGHLKKNEQLPILFASQFSEIWGKTVKRYVHTGHRHHTEEKEHSGMTVIQHTTLSARDAYAARGGWMSERRALAITYHKEFGEVGRVSVNPEMVAK